MQTVIDNILLNYEVLGSKNQNSILILHGWKNSIKNWESIGKNLSHKNKVILLDLPGMGGSSMPSKTFDTYDYADIVNKFITKLNLNNLTLLGHSFGGKFSTVIASKNSRIKKLILVDVSGIRKTTLMIKIKIIAAKILKRISFVPSFVKHFIYNQIASDDLKNAGPLTDSFKKIVGQDISENAKKIKIPTLIVWGENDKEVPLSSAITLKKLIANSTLRIVWRTGHHPHLEKPEKFLEIIYEFV